MRPSSLELYQTNLNQIRTLYNLPRQGQVKSQGLFEINLNKTGTAYKIHLDKTRLVRDIFRFIQIKPKQSGTAWNSCG